MVALLSVAVFLPLKYVYPSKVVRPLLRHTLSWGGLVWAALLVVSILLPSSAADLRLIEISLGYPVYYMGVSVWLGDWRHGWA